MSDTQRQARHLTACSVYARCLARFGVFTILLNIIFLRESLWCLKSCLFLNIMFLNISGITDIIVLLYNGHYISLRSFNHPFYMKMWVCTSSQEYFWVVLANLLIEIQYRNSANAVLIGAQHFYRHQSTTFWHYLFIPQSAMRDYLTCSDMIQHQCVDSNAATVTLNVSLFCCHQ